MKGTFFSADFVKDINNSLRLIEVNTDTYIPDTEASKFNFSELFTVFSNNSITTVDIIYKPRIHGELVEYLTSCISSQASFIQEVNLHPEDLATIYPTAVEDAEDKFILRLAYDESAIFDSQYAKNRLNTFNLFADNSHNGFTVNYYHSSSAGIKNTLDYTFNSGTLPDVSVKDLDESFNPIDFFKVGSTVEGESNEDRWAGFINEHKAEDKVIEQYHYHSSSIDDNGHITSVRQFGLVYGPSLTYLPLHSYVISAVFDLPSDISSELVDGNYSNKLGDYHYYEYTTNFPKGGSEGVLSTHKVLLESGEYSDLDSISIGDKISSFYISGSPNENTNISDELTWGYDGSSFPSGSFFTSSIAMFKEVKNLKYNGLVEVLVDNDPFYVGVNKQFLVYHSSSNRSSYEFSQTLDPSDHYLYGTDGSIIDIDEVNFYSTTDTGLSFIELDVEDTDTYIISGSTSFNSIITHNAPCFVAGTLIKSGEGNDDNVKIEDVKIGDKVLSYNFKSNKTELQPVSATGIKKVNRTVVYNFENGTSLESTVDHPLYCRNNGWVSYDPDYTKSMYNLDTDKISVGCEIVKFDSTSSKIISIDVKEKEAVVYNLRSVDFNHNFYANEYLAHNRGCFLAGTEVTLSNGDLKNIEDILIGEEVLTYNESSKIMEPGTVGDLKTHTVLSIIKVETLDGTLINTTPEHPFYVDGTGWVEAGNLKVGNVLKKDDDTLIGISNIERIEKESKVYNLLSVSDNHNFFVNSILVHNK
jgi:hypothetical protein